jgi:hypothetical protein
MGGELVLSGRLTYAAGERMLAFLELEKAGMASGC